MAKVQVKATKLGYYGNVRQREGSVFFMDEKHMKMVGSKATLPSWVILVSKKKYEPEPDLEDEVEATKSMDDKVI